MQNVTEYLSRHAAAAALMAGCLVGATMAFYFFMEPTVGQSASVDSNDFTVRQEITGAIAFEFQPANITLSGAIDGLTGGTATGSVYASVSTNNATGYNMSLSFEDNSGNGNPNAMEGDDSGGIHIWDYSDGGGEPEYNFAASTSAQFAYTVSASSSSYLDDSFLSSGAACNQGGGSYEAYKCWKGPETGAGFVITDTTDAGATPLGSTTSIQFVVHVPNTPDPALSAEFYTATGTLTATTN